MEKKLVFIVDDEPNVIKLLSFWVEGDEFAVRTFENGETFLNALTEKPDVVCLDLMMPDMDGLDVLKQVQVIAPGLPIIMVTATDSLEIAVNAMKQGAYDYITKPIDRERLKVSLKKAAEKYAMVKEINKLRKELCNFYSFDNIIGKSTAMENVFKKIEKVLENNINVFIHGESGTGKELVSRAVHYQGIRKNGPFEAINCGAIPENLQESEIFGHEKGAFTGAISTQIGKIELAKGGTLFLDEVGEMSPSLQIKLLRFLQDKTFERVGGRHKIHIDVRIISATNKDLENEVNAGNFRKDLFYRLVVYPIMLPSLRERRDDIPALVSHFLNKYNKEAGKNIQTIDHEVMEILMNHNWPGNVRELENVVYRAVVTSEDDTLRLSSLPSELTGHIPFEFGKASGRPNQKNLADVIFASEIIPIAEIEKKAIQHAMTVTQGNLTLAAKKLCMGRATFYRKLDKYNISH